MPKVIPAYSAWPYPVVVANKLHYFCEIDVLRTVYNFADEVPAFWASDELWWGLPDVARHVIKRITTPMHPLYTPYAPPKYPLYTHFTFPIHPLYTPYTPPIHPLYTPYTPPIHPLYTRFLT